MVGNEPRHFQPEESKLPHSPPSAEEECLIKDSKGTKMVWEEEDFQFESCYEIVKGKVLTFLQAHRYLLTWASRVGFIGNIVLFLFFFVSHSVG